MHFEHLKTAIHLQFQFPQNVEPNSAFAFAWVGDSIDYAPVDPESISQMLAGTLALYEHDFRSFVVQFVRLSMATGGVLMSFVNGPKMILATEIRWKFE